MSRRLALIALGCVLTGCRAIGATNASKEPLRVLVKPRAGVSVEALDRILQDHDARRIGAIPQIGVHIIEAAPHSDAHALVAKLKGHPGIEFAEVDARVPPSTK